MHIMWERERRKGEEEGRRKGGGEGRERGRSRERSGRERERERGGIMYTYNQYTSELRAGCADKARKSWSSYGWDLNL